MLLEIRRLSAIERSELQTWPEGDVGETTLMNDSKPCSISKDDAFPLGVLRTLVQDDTNASSHLCLGYHELVALRVCERDHLAPLGNLGVHMLLHHIRSMSGRNT